MNPSESVPPGDQPADEVENQLPDPPAKPRRGRAPLPEAFKELAYLCRRGKLFAVQDWFKTNKYFEPDDFTSVSWPMGIAIESDFHSLVEVLLRNGVPACSRALSRAVGGRHLEIVELLLDHGADVNSISLREVTWTGSPPLIRLFIERGADIEEGDPFTHGFIYHTKSMLGVYKSYVGKFPQLQRQADKALLHFCEEGDLRGVSLLMWLGANPRAAVAEHSWVEEDDLSLTPLYAAAQRKDLAIVQKLKPDPTQDNVHRLLKASLLNQSMEHVRYWLTLGADINYCSGSTKSLHGRVISGLRFELEHEKHLIGCDSAKGLVFAMEWFELGAKWLPAADELKELRKCLVMLPPNSSLKFISFLRSKGVLSDETLAVVVKTPKLQQHLDQKPKEEVQVAPRLSIWADEKPARPKKLRIPRRWR